MKRAVITLMIFGVLLTACSKNATQGPDSVLDTTMPEMTAAGFMEALAGGTYPSILLPAFTPEDIDDLLAFGRDEVQVVNYPSNPVSSYRASSLPRGYLALWAIENIRLNYPYEPSVLRNYPSQNPVLQPREGDFTPIQDAGSLQLVADAYQQWWDTYREEPFEVAREVDPLEELAVRWH